MHDALRTLPTPRAPRTLLPRVMTATSQLRQRPWYARTWLSWPVGWQVASVAAFAMLIAVLAVLWPMAGNALVIPALVRVFWRALLQPLVVIGFALSVVALLMSVAGWNAINRLALSSEGSVHP
jgi:uncharacterized membrane protein